MIIEDAFAHLLIIINEVILILTLRGPNSTDWNQVVAML